jgi:hypothetical protein
MSDSATRRKAREAAASGSEEGLAAAIAAATRSGRGRHSDKYGDWTVVETLQCAWMGVLLGVSEVGGGVGIAHMWPCYWLSNTERLGGLEESARPRFIAGHSTDRPVDVYLSPAVVVTLADPSWKVPPPDKWTSNWTP